jgi:hypothetical protein
VIGNTIIAAPFEPNAFMRPMVLEEVESTWLADTEIGQRLFKIRAANSEGHRSSANILVNRRYAWRGYQSSLSSATEFDGDKRITLVAVGHDEMIGTISVGFDDDDGLCVDGVFPEEVSALREEGRRICEFTKLAMDGVVRSKRVLASLFHVAYIYAHRLKRFDSLLIEVNPRHVRYYERMLGFKVVGSRRLNRRVNAPAVLLCLDFSHAHEQINRFGGKPECAAVERSLYPYFFSVQEEAGIVGRLRGTARRSLRPELQTALSAA